MQWRNLELYDVDKHKRQISKNVRNVRRPDSGPDGTVIDQSLIVVRRYYHRINSESNWISSWFDLISIEISNLKFQSSEKTVGLYWTNFFLNWSICIDTIDQSDSAKKYNFSVIHQVIRRCIGLWTVTVQRDTVCFNNKEKTIYPIMTQFQIIWTLKLKTNYWFQTSSNHWSTIHWTISSISLNFMKLSKHLYSSIE